MPTILALLPNVYWCYNNPSAPKSVQDFNISLRKFTDYNNVKNRIEFDDYLEFWGKSNNYINEIKLQMQKEEYTKLLSIYRKICTMITNAYQTNVPTVLVCYDKKTLEIGLGLWLYFFNQTAGLSFDNVLKMMALKVVGNLGMSDSLKRFFMLLNANANANANANTNTNTNA
uniref:Uncharacterized protein n=1 Tax=viral metagenome TaxID=1070528 RepID=A0A6C0HP84_9ZZZZ